MSKFYAHGKFFDNEEEFWQFCKEWPDMPLDLEEFNREMDVAKKEIELNFQMRGGTLTNRQAHLILRMRTDWAVRSEVPN